MPYLRSPSVHGAPRPSRRLAAILWAAIAFSPAAVTAQVSGQRLLQVTDTPGFANEMEVQISADGETLAWIEYAGFAPRVTLFAGKAPGYGPSALGMPLPVGSDAPRMLRLSADGTLAAFYSDGSVWLQPTKGGAPRRLTPRSTVISDAILDISARGERILYATPVTGTNDLSLEVLEPNTMTVTPITRIPGSRPAFAALAANAPRILVTDTAVRDVITTYHTDGTRLGTLTTISGTVVGLDSDARGQAAVIESLDEGSFRMETVERFGAVTQIGSLTTMRRWPRITSDGERVVWTDEVGLMAAYTDGSDTRRTATLGRAAAMFTLGAGGGTIGIASNGDPLATNPEGDFEIFVQREALRAVGDPTPGGVRSFSLWLPRAAGANYYARLALGRSGGPIVPGVGRVPLSVDPLFWLSGVNGPVFRRMNGVLAAGGRGAFEVAIPAAPSLRGVRFFAAAVVAGNPVQITPAVATVIE